MIQGKKGTAEYDCRCGAEALFQRGKQKAPEDHLFTDRRHDGDNDHEEPQALPLPEGYELVGIRRGKPGEEFRKDISPEQYEKVKSRPAQNGSCRSQKTRRFQFKELPGITADIPGIKDRQCQHQDLLQQHAPQSETKGRRTAGKEHHDQKNGKQQIYRTVIAKYGQNKGLNIYNHIKKYI